MKMLYIWPSEASYNVDNDIRLIYREGNPHSSNMVFGLGPSMKRADLSLQIRPRHAGFGSSRKYSLHSPGPTGGFLRALSFIKKLLHLMVREVLSSVHIIRKMAVALITTVIWMLRKYFVFCFTLLCYGDADIFFRTVFLLLKRMDHYCSRWMNEKKDGERLKRGKKRHTLLHDTTAFMEEFSFSTKTRTEDGYNPRLDDFKNTKFHLSVPIQNIK
ncbi:hypothetical protein P3L10_015872 [Capsicum annuum]